MSYRLSIFFYPTLRTLVSFEALKTICHPTRDGAYHGGLTASSEDAVHFEMPYDELTRQSRFVYFCHKLSGYSGLPAGLNRLAQIAIRWVSNGN